MGRVRAGQGGKGKQEHSPDEEGARLEVVFVHWSACFKYSFFAGAMNPENTRIGFVGIGVMGKSMCRNMMKKGYKATIVSPIVTTHC